MFVYHQFPRRDVEGIVFISISKTSAQVETADLRFVGLVRPHRNNPLTRISTFFKARTPQYCPA